MNHESRKETQKYYNIVYYDYELRSAANERLNRLTFISPQRDILVIDGDVAFYRDQLANGASCQSSEQLNTSLRFMRAIEFRNLNWAVVFINPSPGYVHQRPSIWWVIEQFEGLRAINFVMPYALLDAYCEPCKAVVEAFLGEHKETYDGAVQPKVAFIPFAKGQLLES